MLQGGARNQQINTVSVGAVLRCRLSVLRASPWHSPTVSCSCAQHQAVFSMTFFFFPIFFQLPLTLASCIDSQVNYLQPRFCVRHHFQEQEPPNPKQEETRGERSPHPGDGDISDSVKPALVEMGKSAEC